MDTKKPMMRGPRLAARIGATVGIILVALIAYEAVVRTSVARLAAKVVPVGSELGVVDYLESAIREGMSPEQVHQTVRGYTSRRYFLAPVAGTSDSALIERYSFALPLRDLLFDVDYRSGRVFNATDEPYGVDRSRPLSDAEATAVLRASESITPATP